jgi:deoxyribodipyrimidine photo-lyase
VQNNKTVLPLYILEPELWKQPDLSPRQYRFLIDCLNELDADLKSLGQGLIVKVGDAVSILRALHAKHTINVLFSHQETWNGWTYERDKAVLEWTKENNIPWHEPAQNGVIRRLKDRDGWASRWYGYMKQSPLKPPQALHSIDEPSEPLPDTIGVQDDCLPEKGGRRAAVKILKSFLEQRGEHYTKEMSSPVTAFESCSRLSAHIAFGTLSVREVFQTCERRTTALQQMPPALRGRWPSAMRSFSGRLRWHCHFIQKLEDEPRIEFENMHPAYNGLRENEFNDAYFEAWKAGETGYPMIDACMRALTATGWLNFRMRAMLMSFASYHLWLHWRKPALHLASLFTDYEPGIHYSQVQMQSGTTGINSIRIYNPIKQGVDHDPEGTFIRQWIPELKDMETRFIHTPWEAPSQMNGYPMPIVDEKTARKTATDKLYALRKQGDHKETAHKIVKKHGSRKSRQPLKTRKTSTTQGELPL